MKVISLVYIALFCGNALAQDFSGLELPHDITERIRALEDPDYRGYLERKQRAEEAQHKLRQSQKARREAREERQAKNRELQKRWRKTYKPNIDQARLEKEYELKRLKKVEQEEIADKKYIAYWLREEERQLKEREKMLQKLKQFRMPASLPPPRVDRRRRRY